MKSAETLVRNLFHALGFEISRYHPNCNSLGINPFSDMKKLICQSQRPVVFDVGANVGQSVKRFKDLLPQCEIHSFEPSPATYRLLAQNANSFSDVYLNNLGVGSSCGRKHFLENSSSVMSSFLKPSTFCWGKIVNETPVEVTTLDKYCEENNIPHINVLKADTQGYDLEVLRGATALIGGNRIQMVFMEIIFSDMYQGLPSFDELFRFLLDSNFRLVSLYEFYHQNNVASWSDALFINTGFDFDNRPANTLRPTPDAPLKK